MSLARKQALITAAVWFMVLVGFAVLFARTGVAAFGAAENKAPRLVAAAIILPGYLANAFVFGWARRGRRQGELDERDAAVARQASEISLVVVTMVVFATALALFETHRDAGLVPVGWLWFMAYGSFALVSFTQGAASLWADLRGPRDG